MMSRAFKTRRFQRWARRAGLADSTLWQAVREMQAGLVDADLGGSLLKKRVPLPGRGKRGSVRTLVAYRRSGHWFFLFGFQKNEREDLPEHALQTLRDEGGVLLALGDGPLEELLRSGTLMEIENAKA